MARPPAAAATTGQSFTARSAETEPMMSASRIEVPRSGCAMMRKQGSPMPMRASASWTRPSSSRARSCSRRASARMTATLAISDGCRLNPPRSSQRCDPLIGSDRRRTTRMAAMTAARPTQAARCQVR